MSGAAEGIAGVALSAVGLIALFTTVIQCFDVIDSARNQSVEYNRLLVLFGNQRLRCQLWGEIMDLVPPQGTSHSNGTAFDEIFNRPNAREQVSMTLYHIKELFDEATKMDNRYGLQASVESLSTEKDSSAPGLHIFQHSFNKFKLRLRKNQDDASTWTVTKWAVYDGKKFEKFVRLLKDLVEDLWALTNNLKDVREQQQARVDQEIASIEIIADLELLRDASIDSDPGISDTASQRLASIESLSIVQTMAETTLSDLDSYFTAPEYLNVSGHECPQVQQKRALGAWISAFKYDGSQEQHQKKSTSIETQNGQWDTDFLESRDWSTEWADQCRDLSKGLTENQTEDLVKDLTNDLKNDLKESLTACLRSLFRKKLIGNLTKDLEIYITQYLEKNLANVLEKDPSEDQIRKLIEELTGELGGELENSVARHLAQGLTSDLVETLKRDLPTVHEKASRKSLTKHQTKKLEQKLGEYVLKYLAKILTIDFTADPKKNLTRDLARHLTRYLARDLTKNLSTFQTLDDLRKHMTEHTTDDLTEFLKELLRADTKLHLRLFLEEYYIIDLTKGLEENQRDPLPSFEDIDYGLPARYASEEPWTLGA